MSINIYRNCVKIPGPDLFNNNKKYYALAHIFNNNNIRDKVQNYLEELLRFPITLRNTSFEPSLGRVFLEELGNLTISEDILIEILEELELYNALALFYRAPLEILKQPDEETQDSRIVVKKGCKLILKFKVFGLPYPEKFTWYRKKLNSNEIEVVTCQPEGNLVIENLSPDQQGMYFCKAEVKQYEDDYYEEDMETSVTSNNINVVIFPELYIISKPLPNAFKNEGESFTFDIKTNGYPTPEYEWTHGNKIIGRNKKIIKKQCSFDDSGEYRCRIWNTSKEIIVKINLQIVQYSLFPICKEPVVEKIALLIGNEDYQHRSKLHTPLKDIDCLEEELKKIGFLVIKKYNLNLLEMKDCLQNFCDILKSTEGAYAFVYFGGHGFELGEKYLLPIDVSDEDVSTYENCICACQILRDVLQTNPKLFIFVLDMCLSLPSRNGIIYKLKPDIYEYKTNKNLIQAYATSSRLNVHEINGQLSVQGPYCEALTKYIGENLPISKIMANVNVAVAKNFEKINQKIQNGKCSQKLHPIIQEPSFSLNYVKDFYLNVPKIGSNLIKEKYEELLNKI